MVQIASFFSKCMYGYVQATVRVPSEQQELAQALKRLSEAERMLNRRQGHAPSASPPASADWELSSHMASSPVSRLYEEVRPFTDAVGLALSRYCSSA